MKLLPPQLKEVECAKKEKRCVSNAASNSRGMKENYLEEDKAKLVEETEFQLKKKNRFINQSKRNWYSNSQSVIFLKSNPMR
ncbi:hypothetical protein H5410_027537 [Solanum commersonii]|uniref:Uncharacterized protein n=1 Tax=Solanum commersonii TaxID=4109 RepID=A0A9J5Z1I8_SOLCO|nr:hypothetical protein H5410_027537 [Solanum commersonii]